MQEKSSLGQEIELFLLCKMISLWAQHQFTHTTCCYSCDESLTCYHNFTLLADCERNFDLLVNHRLN